VKIITLVVFLLQISTAGYSQARAMSSEEKAYFYANTFKRMRMWDTISNYYCSDIAIDCSCPFEGDYSSDSSVYSYRQWITCGLDIDFDQLDTNALCDFSFTFHRKTKAINLFDNKSNKAMSITEYNIVLREFWRKRH
jgi:hypothetical protein